MGVGGVMSPETAMEKFDAGADLVQLITGLIYEGPSLVKKMCTAYEARQNNK
jgi:dihydroorotate dehydrogenase